MEPSPAAITVCLLTHNYARYIVAAIESVIQQERTDWELFICDDASTDETAELVKPYLTNARVHYVFHPENLGQSGNWRHALGLGHAPVLAVLHADDRWLPGALSTVLPMFESDPELDFVYGNWKIAKEGSSELAPGLQAFDHELPGKRVFAHQIGRNTWLPSAAFVRRKLIERIGLPHPTFSMVVDIEYHLRVSAHARKVRALSRPLVIYRVHESSTSAESYRNGVLLRELQELPKVVAEWAERDPELAPSLRPLGCSAAETVFSLGVVAGLEGNVDEAKRRMAKALAMCPHLARRKKVIADLLLLRLGLPGRKLFRFLHRKSFPGYVSER